MDSLELIRCFREVASRGSFSGAAPHLGISKAQVSKSVAALETRMGVRLLHRSTRSVTLTDAGALLLERSTPLIDLIESTTDAVAERAREPSGRVRLSAVLHLSDHEFVDVLADFQRRYPKVHLSMEFTNRRVDLIEEAVDMVFRVGPIRDDDLIIRKLQRVDFVVAASPSYWAQHGKPTHPSELSKHQCLVYASDNSARSGHQMWPFIRNGKLVEVQLNAMTDANDGRPLARMAMAGVGVIASPLGIVAREIANGRLEPVLTDWSSPEMWLYIAYAQRRHMGAAQRALMEFIETKLKQAV